MRFSVLKPDPDYQNWLDSQLLDFNGRIRLLHAKRYQYFNQQQLRCWASKKAIYQFPTIELIDWIKGQIGSYKCIEIGSGNNDLGFHLGIIQTDSYSQQNAISQVYYALNGQVPTKPRPDVKRMDAIEAIIHYRPDIVLGSWITQKSYEESGPEDGNAFGPEERDFLNHIKFYIHVGNLAIHARKRICSLHHRVYKCSWLVSRAISPEHNCIQVWEGKC